MKIVRPWLLALALSGHACAQKAAPPPAGAPQAAPSAPPAASESAGDKGKTRGLTELDALEHDLDQSERFLFAQLERARTKAEIARAPAADEEWKEVPPRQPPPTAGARKKPATAPAQQAAPKTSEELSARGSACDLSCRALRSMRRSADGICELAGQTDARCQKARERVRVGEERVRGVGCACAAPR